MILSIVIDTNGVPGDVRVVRSLGPEPDQKAIKAIKQWRFEPARIGAMMINVEVIFHLRQRPSRYGSARDR